MNEGVRWEGQAAREHIMLQHEGSLGLRHYILEDESVRRVPDGTFHGGRPDSLSREQGMQEDPGNVSHMSLGEGDSRDVR